MDSVHFIALTIFIFFAAVLYAAVGHAGASGYLAAMGLFGVSAAVMKPTALVLNILVATIATIRYCHAGCFSWRTFWPFTIASIPCAFVGGALTLPVGIYKPAVGLILLLAAWRLILLPKPTDENERKSLRRPTLLISMPVGATIGFVSGITGTGGGIFLSPFLIFMRWAGTRQSCGISAAFILANSISGLVGNLTSAGSLPSWLPIWIAIVVVGAIIGTELGVRRLSIPNVRKTLGLVLLVASLKLLFVK